MHLNKTVNVMATATGLLVASALSQVPAAEAAGSPWVERSNGNAAILLKVIGEFDPEEASSYGLEDCDARIVDLRQGRGQRLGAALAKARRSLVAALARETDPPVREDLQILIHACDLKIEDESLNDRLLLPYLDVGRMIFDGEFSLLQEQSAPSRRGSALARLRNYTGIDPGGVPVIQLAKNRFEDSVSGPARLGPYRAEVEQGLENSQGYAKGIRDLFARYSVAGAAPALDALDSQLKDYDAWVRRVVLPRARDDFRLPPEIYAFNLRAVGLGVSPQELIQRAEVEYGEAQNELRALAPLVAREHGLTGMDYRSVIRQLKKEQLGASEIEPYYRQVIAKIEEVVRREHIITLPDRPLSMRLASDAETAAVPAPHYRPPPLIGNTGESGQFVLPLANPHAAGNGSASFDDFTFKAAAWTFAAHEGRPGHDLQFAAMVERGVSQARSIFAYNSVNVEGWALYAEAETKPYEPLEGQMIALQGRLLRAARAILDPMLNLGLMSRERAHDVLTRDVVVSEAMAAQELDRYTFRLPGQATAYFFGYSRLMELRASTEIALGAKFDRFAFNNFIIAQGLLPPDLLAAAVQTEFIPSLKN